MVHLALLHRLYGVDAPGRHTMSIIDRRSWNTGSDTLNSPANGGTVNQHIQEQAGSTLTRYGHLKLTAT